MKMRPIEFSLGLARGVQLTLFLVLLGCTADGFQCPSETVNGIAWPASAPGAQVVESCPAPSAGSALRVCCDRNYADAYPSEACFGTRDEAQWLAPSYATCWEPVLHSLASSNTSVLRNITAIEKGLQRLQLIWPVAGVDDIRAGTILLDVASGLLTTESGALNASLALLELLITTSPSLVQTLGSNAFQVSWTDLRLQQVVLDSLYEIGSSLAGTATQNTLVEDAFTLTVFNMSVQPSVVWPMTSQLETGIASSVTMYATVTNEPATSTMLCIAVLPGLSLFGSPGTTASVAVALLTDTPSLPSASNMQHAMAVDVVFGLDLLLATKTGLLIEIANLDQDVTHPDDLSSMELIDDLSPAGSTPEQAFVFRLQYSVSASQQNQQQGTSTTEPIPLTSSVAASPYCIAYIPADDVFVSDACTLVSATPSAATCQCNRSNLVVAVGLTLTAAGPSNSSPSMQFSLTNTLSQVHLVAAGITVFVIFGLVAGMSASGPRIVRYADINMMLACFGLFLAAAFAFDKTRWTQPSHCLTLAVAFQCAGHIAMAWCSATGLLSLYVARSNPEADDITLAGLRPMRFFFVTIWTVLLAASVLLGYFRSGDYAEANMCWVEPETVTFFISTGVLLFLACTAFVFHLSAALLSQGASPTFTEARHAAVAVLFIAWMTVVAVLFYFDHSKILEYAAAVAAMLFALGCLVLLVIADAPLRTAIAQLLCCMRNDRKNSGTNATAMAGNGGRVSKTQQLELRQLKNPVAKQESRQSLQDVAQVVRLRSNDSIQAMYSQINKGTSTLTQLVEKLSTVEKRHQRNDAANAIPSFNFHAYTQNTSVLAGTLPHRAFGSNDLEWDDDVPYRPKPLGKGGMKRRQVFSGEYDNFDGIEQLDDVGLDDVVADEEGQLRVKSIKRQNPLYDPAGMSRPVSIIASRSRGNSINMRSDQRSSSRRRRSPSQSSGGSQRRNRKLLNAAQQMAAEAAQGNQKPQRKQIVPIGGIKDPVPATSSTNGRSFKRKHSSNKKKLRSNKHPQFSAETTTMRTAMAAVGRPKGEAAVKTTSKAYAIRQQLTRSIVINEDYQDEEIVVREEKITRSGSSSSIKGLLRRASRASLRSLENMVRGSKVGVDSDQAAEAKGHQKSDVAQPSTAWDRSASAQQQQQQQQQQHQQQQHQQQQHQHGRSDYTPEDAHDLHPRQVETHAGDGGKMVTRDASRITLASAVSLDSAPTSLPALSRQQSQENGLYDEPYALDRVPTEQSGGAESEMPGDADYFVMTEHTRRKEGTTSDLPGQDDGLSGAVAKNPKRRQDSLGKRLPGQGDRLQRKLNRLVQASRPAPGHSAQQDEQQAGSRSHDLHESMGSVPDDVEAVASSLSHSSQNVELKTGTLRRTTIGAAKSTGPLNPQALALLRQRKSSEVSDGPLRDAALQALSNIRNSHEDSREQVHGPTLVAGNDKETDWHKLAERAEQSTTCDDDAATEAQSQANSEHTASSNGYVMPSVLRGLGRGERHETARTLRMQRENSREGLTVDVKDLGLERPLEFPRSDVEVLDQIGKGAFAVVNRARLLYRDKSAIVAVKMPAMKAGPQAAAEEGKSLIAEIGLMARLKHENVLQLIGFVTASDPVMIILEFMEKGSLHKILRTNRLSHTSRIRLLHDVASGMDYLHSKRLLHRDIASRNILVGHGVAKISDFGFSIHLPDGYQFVLQQTGKIPVRWTAPEALNYGKYSLGSDAWSFGVTIYEAYTRASLPFKGWSNLMVATHVGLGHRLPPPKGCLRAMYRVMMDCWHPEPTARPTFKEICSRLSTILSSDALLKEAHNGKKDPLQNIYRATKVNGYPLAQAWMAVRHIKAFEPQQAAQDKDVAEDPNAPPVPPRNTLDRRIREETLRSLSMSADQACGDDDARSEIKRGGINRSMTLESYDQLATDDKLNPRMEALLGALRDESGNAPANTIRTDGSLNNQSARHRRRRRSTSDTVSPTGTDAFGPSSATSTDLEQAASLLSTIASNQPRPGKRKLSEPDTQEAARYFAHLEAVNEDAADDEADDEDDEERTSASPSNLSKLYRPSFKAALEAEIMSRPSSGMQPAMDSEADRSDQERHSADSIASAARNTSTRRRKRKHRKYVELLDEEKADSEIDMPEPGKHTDGADDDRPVMVDLEAQENLEDEDVRALLSRRRNRSLRRTFSEDLL